MLGIPNTSFTTWTFTSDWQFCHIIKEEVFCKQPNANSNFIVRERQSFESLQITTKTQEPFNEVYEPVEQCLAFFNYYFAHCLNSREDTTNTSVLPNICWSSVCKKDSFSEKVLRTLLDQVKIGSTISYKSLASLVGALNAQRAVGSVMRKNPICLIIPCHRVINTVSNKVGNYNGGVEIKEWLLNHEKKFL